MNDLSQSKKYCFYTISDYICCHMYLHNTIFVQYTIIQHHCQTCEIKYGKLLLLLRSDTPEEKQKSEITETSWERGKDFPEIYWKTNASQSWSELARAFQKQTNVLDLKSVYQLSECLAVLLLWKVSSPEEMRRWYLLVILLLEVPIHPVHLSLITTP